MNEKQAIQVEEELEDTQEGVFLTFNLADEDYGIEIRDVTEIIGIQNITILPDTPDYVRGVINLRGKVIPLVDVRIRFKLEEKEYDERTCIIVVHVNNQSIGLIVDEVSEVMDIPATNMDPPPEMQKGSASRYVRELGKVDDSVKIILDTQSLLFE